MELDRQMDGLLNTAERQGLVAITATLGKSSWNTSLMPMGDSTQFILLNAKIRKAENVIVGNHIKLLFKPRKR